MFRTVLGEVVRGQGHATPWADTDAIIAKIIGRTLHPGTINLLVPDPTSEHRILDHGGGIEPQRIRARGWHKFCPCTLDGHPGFIICTWRGAIYPPETVIPETTLLEIVAERLLPNIPYGRENVVLDYDPKAVETRRV
jgi:CTP-dependent riboflavin kinase